METCTYDFYERGYWDSIQFSYVPDFRTKEDQLAWCLGFADGKQGQHKTIDEFEKEV